MLGSSVSKDSRREGRREKRSKGGCRRMGSKAAGPQTKYSKSSQRYCARRSWLCGSFDRFLACGSSGRGAAAVDRLPFELAARLRSCLKGWSWSMRMLWRVRWLAKTVLADHKKGRRKRMYDERSGQLEAWVGRRAGVVGRPQLLSSWSALVAVVAGGDLIGDGSKSD